MHRQLTIAVILCLSLWLAARSYAQVGQLPTPTLFGVQSQAAVTVDLTSQIYTYHYTVSNPSSNTGEIWLITVDVSTPFPKSFAPPFDSTDWTISYGVSTLTFDEMVSLVSPLDLSPSSGYVVAFGQQVPTGWTGGLSNAGLGHVAARDNTPNVVPGGSITGLVLKSRGLPTLRPMQAIPFGDSVVASETEATPAIEAAAAQIRQTITFQTVTLGPSGVSAGSAGHWDQLRDDLNQARLLGWIPDLGLANALVTQLASARQAYDAIDGTTVKTRLNTLIQTISGSIPAQRRAEVAALVLYSTQALRDNTLDTPIPFEPRLSLTPGTSQGAIGTTQTLTATVLNFGVPTHDPVSGFAVHFIATEGPNAGFEFTQFTDGNGKAPVDLQVPTWGPIV